MSTTIDTRHNGYKNFETWAVGLWLSNDEPTYTYWRKKAAWYKRIAPVDENVQEGIWTEAETAKFRLADKMKTKIEEASPLNGDGGTLYSDLLNAALSEVDWHEVAQDFLED